MNNGDGRNAPASRRLRQRIRAALAVVVSAAGLTLGTGLTQAEAATPAVRDGSSSTLASPSCWAIKQQNPASTDGVYWLQTAALIAPQQFYCDQTTDGGGWVLVGRGREGWSWSENGIGTPGAVRTSPTGTTAFAPAALPTDTITGLLDGGRVDALTDGVRIRRAKDVAGSTYQEMRLMPTNRSTWSWAFGGGLRFSQLVIDGVNKGGGTANSFNSDSSYNAINSATSTLHNSKMGFGYGSSIVGSSAATSYLWSNTTESKALPFTQVWLRPKLTSSSFTPITSSGLPASTERAMVSDQTSPNTPWGVTGVHGSGELHTEVEALAQVGNVMYVGGDFAYVQKGATPAADQKIAQPYLAGFDVDTGEWLSTFRPTVNGVVWDLQALPNGLLAVGGEFTSIDGKATALAVLDPSTGAIASGWSGLTVTSSDATASTPGTVRAMDVQDGWLYAGGRFNRATGGTPSFGPVTVSRAARFRVSDGRPDGSWKPTFDGTIIELDAAPTGDRVYFTGYFATINGNASKNEGAVTTSAPAAFVTGLSPWVPSTGSGTATYQQAIKDAGNGWVWQGGSEHILSQYDSATYTRKASYITKSGGDIQTIGVMDGVTFASCHCNNYIYSGTINYSNPISDATDVHNINFIGAFDSASGQLIANWYPSALDARIPIGAWELEPDQRGCLWFGGDFTRGSYRNSAYQWLGGFGKFCQNDSTAPTVPGAAQESLTAGGAKVSWTPSTDTGGSVTYEVLRDDRVIGTTASTSFVDPSATYPATYWVRAVDQSGNRSATSTSVTEQGPDTIPPTAPSGLTVNAVSPTAATLSWTAASDNVGVSGYVVSRNGATVATVNGTSFSDTALAGSTTYEFTVRAVDAAGNAGPQSEPASVTTPAADPALFTDRFAGADDDAWQSAWAASTASGSVTTQAGAGAVSVTDTSGAYARAQLTGVPTRSDSSVLTSYQWNSSSAGAYFSVYLRGSGGWKDGYRPRNGYGLQFTSTSATVAVQKADNGTMTAIRSVAGGQKVTTAKQWLRFEVNGSTIQFRTWLDGQSEPSTWNSVDTDSTVTAPGQLFVSVDRAGANVGIKSVSLDDLQMFDS